jgi:predicted metal-dependent phosphotriesterase family hydrolase
MKSPKTLAGSIAVLLFALVILGFGISPVSASAGSSPSGNSTAMHGHWDGQHFTPNSTQQYTMTESFITRLQSQGVDVSAVQTALANNDTETVKSWITSYMETHKGTFGNTTHMQKGHGFTVNATAQQAHLQSFITQLQNKGVDVSTVQTALANNDMATVNSWVKSYMEAHKETFGNTTHMQKGHGFTVNATAQQAHLQSFITQLQNKGVDVSTVQTALANNDTATVNSWLKSYFEAHPGAFGNTTRSQWHMRNTTATQSS